MPLERVKDDRPSIDVILEDLDQILEDLDQQRVELTHKYNMELEKLLREREYKSTCEAWTLVQKGRALEMIRLLANTPHKEWRTKKELHAALSEFRNQ